MNSTHGSVVPLAMFSSWFQVLPTAPVPWWSSSSWRISKRKTQRRRRRRPPPVSLVINSPFSETSSNMKDSLAHVSFPKPRNLHRIANIGLKSSPGGRDPRPQRSASQSCLNQIKNILTSAIKINIRTSRRIIFRESVLSDIAKIVMPDDLPHEHSYYFYHHQQQHHISNPTPRIALSVGSFVRPSVGDKISGAS